MLTVGSVASFSTVVAACVAGFPAVSIILAVMLKVGLSISVLTSIVDDQAPPVQVAESDIEPIFKEIVSPSSEQDPDRK